MLKVTFYGTKSEVLTIEGANLRDVLKIQRDEKFKFIPLAFKTTSGKKMFYHDNVIHTFLDNEDMSLAELVEHCECDNVWQNTTDLLTHNKIKIDKGYYWKQNNDLLVLVDDDQYIESVIDNSCFELKV